MLYDSITGYISCFKIYSGINRQSLKDTAMELLTNFCGKWHHLYMDNYYSSVELMEYLLIMKIRVCEMLRQNKGLSEKLKNSKLNVFETKYQRRRDVFTQVWKASNTKVIKTISTIHKINLVETKKQISRKTNSTIQKPETILDYNKYVKGVDRVDEFLSYYPMYRKTIKWSKIVVLYLLNCALYQNQRI